VSNSVFVCALALGLVACGPKPKPTPDSTPPLEQPAATSAEPTPTPRPATSTPKPATPKATPIKRVPVSTAPPPAELWKEFSGEHAWRTAKQLAEIGPRPAGSMELGRARALLLSALRTAGWEVEQQTFTATSPRGEIPGANLIARFSADGERPVPRTPRAVVIAAHYDTRYFSTIRFVGANDGASGPAALVEIARVLALDPSLAAKIELVLFDVGEPRGQFSADDGLAGSRHYAKTSPPPSRGIVLHGIGDAQSPLTLPPETPIEILNDIRTAAPTLSAQLRMQVAPVKLWGDHLPLGPRALMLNNTENLARYTADDTIERVSPAALGIAGELAVWLAKRWAAAAP